MARKPRGFLQTGGLLKSQISKVSETRGFAQTRLLTNWAEIAGASIARVTRPLKIGYSKSSFGATLTLYCEGASAPMVQMQVPQIIERVNALYGYQAINKIALTQTATDGFGEKPNQFAHKKPTKELSQDDKNRVELFVKDVSDDKLKEALSKLGERVVKKEIES